MTLGLFAHYDRSPVTDLVLTQARQRELFKSQPKVVSTKRRHVSAHQRAEILQAIQSSNSLMLMNSSTDVGSHKKRSCFQGESKINK